MVSYTTLCHADRRLKPGSPPVFPEILIVTAFPDRTGTIEYWAGEIADRVTLKALRIPASRSGVEYLYKRVTGKSSACPQPIERKGLLCSGAKNAARTCYAIAEKSDAENIPDLVGREHDAGRGSPCHCGHGTRTLFVGIVGRGVAAGVIIKRLKGGD